MNVTTPDSNPADAPKDTQGRSGPIAAVIHLFSSIWLGVFLLTLLFIYSAVGSSGVPTSINIFDPANWLAVRQYPGLEMTEFEWFHWWPFDLLIALICINLVVATLRRIPLNVLNLGVWMIHTGIIILALGSVWYFTTKVEGDSPVARRRIFVQAPGMAEPKSMVASPGASMLVGEGAEGYLLQVREIDPQWELLSGDDKGKRSYKVSVMVQSKGGMFIRDLVAGRPEYTQDLIRSTDPNDPPFTRAVKAIGKPLVDEAIKITLDYDPQEYFYLMDSHALYLRAAGESEWVQRPIENLPRYNDYVMSVADVWPDGGAESLKPRPLSKTAARPIEPDDPLPSTTFNVSRYLRYAVLESRRKPSAMGPLNPVVTFRLDPLRGQPQRHQLLAFDPSQNSALQGSIQFSWLQSSDQLEKLKKRIEPALRFTIPGEGGGVTVEKTITNLTRIDPALEFQPIEGTEYSFRVEALQDNMNISGRKTSIAIVQIKSPQRTFTRWVFDDPSLNRDLGEDGQPMAGHSGEAELDKSIETAYKPGELRTPIMFVAGPGETELGLIVTKVVGQPTYTPVKKGDALPVAEGVSIEVLNYAARTMEEQRPLVIPREQRERDAREHFSMICLDVPKAQGFEQVWLPYHNYIFDEPESVLRRQRYQPRRIQLADGREYELMFGRARLPLPAPVALEEFQVEAHVGGYTGSSSSIADWRSVVRFLAPDGLSESLTVSVNKPKEFDGYWFFQAMWDPPDREARFEGDPGSNGLNYTVLGVGNRNGVHVQLLGCCIAVLGMIYAFYVKPAIKRRRQKAIYASIASEKATREKKVEQAAPVGAAWKVQP